MVLSMFDQQLFHFGCKCGHVEPIVIGRLDNVTSWACARCGQRADLGVEPYRSVIEKIRDTASELDKQARERGKNIERIKD